jgi:hypothetical protein
MAMESTKPEEEKPVPVNHSAGTILTIAVILTMIVIGAFYSWGKRIAEQQATNAQYESQTVSQ